MPPETASGGAEAREGGASGRGKKSAWGPGRIALIVVGLAVIYFLGRRAGDLVPQFARWVESLGALGPLVFIGGYILATVAFVPGWLLTMAAGAIFGILEGTLYVFAGAVVGTAAAFLVARHVARGFVAGKVKGDARFEAIDSAVEAQGLKLVLLLRLSPVFPYNLLNYALGLTRVRFIHYVIASVGMIPGTLLYVYYGKVVGDIAALAGGAEVQRGWGYYTVLGLGLAATIAVTAVVTRMARKALKEAAGEKATAG